MKTIFILFVSYFLILQNGYAQSTVKASYPSSNPSPNSAQSNIYQKNSERNYNAHPLNADTLYKANQNRVENEQQSTIYIDTRLGSSSKMYDTYEKNDYGAGAITTNPNK